MEEAVVTILRSSAERGLPRLLIGGNAVILLGFVRTRANLDLDGAGFRPFPLLDLLWSWAGNFTKERCLSPFAELPDESQSACK